MSLSAGRFLRRGRRSPRRIYAFNPVWSVWTLTSRSSKRLSIDDLNGVVEAPSRRPAVVRSQSSHDPNRADFRRLVWFARSSCRRCAWANDVSEKKAAVYRANFGQRSLRLGDVARVEADELPHAQLAWASFPCQTSRSRAGGGHLRARSGTFWQFWRLMREMGARRPPLIVLENVVGLLHGDNFGGLCEALADLDLRFGAMVIDAKWFVPQSRPRVFVVATDVSVDVTPWSGPEEVGTAVRQAFDSLACAASRALGVVADGASGSEGSGDPVADRDKRGRAGVV
ncbi:MAG: DNA cytosine methyltransferase [Bryobacterales bacterium]